MALKLGSPTSVECIKKEGASPFMFPKQSLIRFDFPARGNMPAVQVFWHDAMKEQPAIPGVPDGEFLGDMPSFPRPQGQAQGQGQQAAAPRRPAAPTGFVGGVFNYEQYMARVEQAKPTAAKPNGSVFIGSKGMLTTGTYGENTRLIPVAKMADYKFPPELLTRSPGHYRDWIRACKGGDPACSNFSVSAPFTETILLGVLATRFDGKLEWDAAKMRVTNNQDANKFLKPVVRKGWSLT